MDGNKSDRARPCAEPELERAIDELLAPLRKDGERKTAVELEWEVNRLVALEHTLAEAFGPDPARWPSPARKRWVELSEAHFELLHTARVLEFGFTGSAGEAAGRRAGKGEREDVCPTPSPPPVTVPPLGERILALCCTGDHREAMLGDLAERFEALAGLRSAEAARAWYWWQVVRSVAALGMRWGRRLMELDVLLQRIGL